MTDHEPPSHRREFAARVVDLIDASGLSRAEFARRAALIERKLPDPPKRAPSFSEQRLSDWCSGRNVPNERVVTALVHTTVQARRSQGLSPANRLTPGLLSFDRWLSRRRLARAERPTGQPGERAPGPGLPAPAPVDVPTEPIAPRNTPAGPASRPPHEPVGDWLTEATDPFALGVHRSIAVRRGRSAGSPPLPPYVRRAHDERLAAGVDAAVTAGESTLLWLTGDSSYGKSRACWEALGALRRRGDWRLWAPYSAEEALAGLHRVAPHTVIWLDETRFTCLPATGGADGRQLADRIDDLVHSARRAPVLVLGTMWTRTWHELTAGTAPRARCFQSLLRDPIPVPPRFTDDDMRALGRAASTDARLAAASEQAADGEVAQWLAGTPVVLARWEAAPENARALLLAAMDIRRLGHDQRIPLALLEAAVPVYLSPSQRERLLRRRDWLREALSYATEECLGAAGPLTPTPPPADAPPGVPHYRLSDVLDQYGQEQRTVEPVPPALWRTLAAHMDATGLLELARTAHHRGLYRLAHDLCGDALRAGNRDAWWQAAEFLRHQGRIPEAEAWTDAAAEASDAAALAWIASLRWETDPAGDPWFARAVDAAADPEPLVDAAGHLYECGDSKRAREWYDVIIDRFPDGTAALDLAWRLVETGEWDEALRYYENAARDGNLDAYQLACVDAVYVRRWREARELLARAVAVGRTRHLFESYAPVPDEDWPEANAFFRAAVASGLTEARSDLTGVDVGRVAPPGGGAGRTGSGADGRRGGFAVRTAAAGRPSERSRGTAEGISLAGTRDAGPVCRQPADPRGPRGRGPAGLRGPAREGQGVVPPRGRGMAARRRPPRVRPGLVRRGRLDRPGNAGGRRPRPGGRRSRAGGALLRPRAGGRGRAGPTVVRRHPDRRAQLR
ncbi:tetratricopeptide repeat protein [Streptomyces sp. ITFR-6]|uniref:tetratricopeptide repeat protein n=1 Tax=Streptomyces sp. ITFR-6 TaxID=3075197 RepID=UPI00288C2C1B|nr:tetratricopeptide repeat protein [Streptomyces sp. ITFR-6]WNI28285.1 tetratricopeptide repeat protein [Streptomyces sp. ITFR-6]